MSFLQLVLSLDKTIKEIILFWRICQFDRYRNRKHRLVIDCHPINTSMIKPKFSQEGIGVASQVIEPKDILHKTQTTI